MLSTYWQMSVHDRGVSNGIVAEGNGDPEVDLLVVSCGYADSRTLPLTWSLGGESNS
jgi:hypothetical protein